MSVFDLSSYIASRMRRYAIVLVLTVIALPAMGQLNNSFLEWPRVYDEADSGRFYAGFRTLGFMRNNEYFNYIDGYTLFGYQFNPFVAWQAGRHVRIEAGAYLAQSFGEDDFDQILPTFTISYQKRNHRILFGTLRGTLSHRLIEPLFDFENVLNQNRPEYGFQYRLESDQLFIDAWIDWRNAISAGDEEQEELLAGFSGEYKFIQQNAGGFSLLLQSSAFHQGGQIDATDLPVATYYNMAAGLKWWFSPAGKIRLISTDAYFVASAADGGDLPESFNSGDGFYANLLVESAMNLGLMISYWKSEDYYSPAGGQLYQNISYTDETFGTDRQLLFFRLLYDRELSDGLHLGIRGEPFLDLSDNEFEWSAGFYLVYDIQFKLGNKNKK